MLNAAYSAWKSGGSAVQTPTLTPRASTLGTPSAGKTRLSHRKAYVWRGSVSPKQIGTSSVSIRIERRTNGHWVHYRTTPDNLNDGTGGWSKSLRVGRTGRYRLRFRHADGDHRGKNSAWREFTVY
ncbi:MAG: hypothetical protein HGB10_10005 [Coriobacteriia bacterium]|nr:hypothetical protein [Coriobacteriia bacterium]